MATCKIKRIYVICLPKKGNIGNFTWKQKVWCQWLRSTVSSCNLTSIFIVYSLFNIVIETATLLLWPKTYYMYFVWFCVICLNFISSLPSAGKKLEWWKLTQWYKCHSIRYTCIFCQVHSLQVFLCDELYLKQSLLSIVYSVAILVWVMQLTVRCQV